MGSSASINALSGPNGIFVDDKLRKGESLMKLNESLRASFVTYVKDYRWAAAFDSVESSFVERVRSSNSTWTKFGYKSPHCSGGAKSKDLPTEESFKVSQHKVVGQKHLENEQDDGDYGQLFQRNGLRAVLIAVLLPLFLDNAGVGDTTNNSVVSSSAESGESTPESRQTQSGRVKPGSLHAWLLSATSKFTAEELTEYLANSSTNWAQDFLQAIQSVPAVVSLSTVDPAKEASKIVFSNSSEKSLVGANMHEVFSTDCSPGGAAQLYKAIFEAKRYKRCLTSFDGTCCLRALKPVYNHQGQHVYTLGLESRPFKDPVLSSQDFDDSPGEESFQQIEDLLLLMPVLIRNYKWQPKQAP